MAETLPELSFASVWEFVETWQSSLKGRAWTVEVDGDLAPGSEAILPLRLPPGDEVVSWPCQVMAKLGTGYGVQLAAGEAARKVDARAALVGAVIQEMLDSGRVLLAPAHGSVAPADSLLSSDRQRATEGFAWDKLDPQAPQEEPVGPAPEREDLEPTPEEQAADEPTEALPVVTEGADFDPFAVQDVALPLRCQGAWLGQCTGELLGEFLVDLALERSSGSLLIKAGGRELALELVEGKAGEGQVEQLVDCCGLGMLTVDWTPGVTGAGAGDGVDLRRAVFAWNLWALGARGSGSLDVDFAAHLKSLLRFDEFDEQLFPELAELSPSTSEASPMSSFLQQHGGGGGSYGVVVSLAFGAGR